MSAFLRECVAEYRHVESLSPSFSSRVAAALLSSSSRRSFFRASTPPYLRPTPPIVPVAPTFRECDVEFVDVHRHSVDVAALNYNSGTELPTNVTHRYWSYCACVCHIEDPSTWARLWESMVTTRRIAEGASRTITPSNSDHQQGIDVELRSRYRLRWNRRSRGHDKERTRVI